MPTLIGTSIPDVKKALEDLFKASPALGSHPDRPVQVSGFGRPKNMEKEVVVVGNAYGDQESTVLSNRKRRETYRLRVTVNVRRVDDQEGTTRKAVALSREVERELGAANRQTPVLGVDGVLKALPGSYDLIELDAPEGTEAEVRIELSVTADVSTL